MKCGARSGKGFFCNLEQHPASQAHEAHGLKNSGNPYLIWKGEPPSVEILFDHLYGYVDPDPTSVVPGVPFEGD